MATPAPPVTTALRELNDALATLEATLDTRLATDADKDEILEAAQRQARIARAQAHYAADELANAITALKDLMARAQTADQTNGAPTRDQ